MSSTGTGASHKATPKPGGNPKTLALGVAAVAAGLGLFYYSRVRAHKKDDQTYIERQNQRLSDKGRDTGTRIVNATPKQEPRPASQYIPTPVNK